MTDETMATKLRQAEKALLALAEKLDVPMDNERDGVGVIRTNGKWSMFVVSHGVGEPVTGKGLEECYLKVLDEPPPF